MWKWNAIKKKLKNKKYKLSIKMAKITMKNIIENLLLQGIMSGSVISRNIAQALKMNLKKS